MAIIITIANQKGGVGKTTTAVNLATAIAVCGYKVTVIDLDSQGNASTGFGIDNRDKNSYQFMAEQYSYQQAKQETNIPNLSIIPATIDLAAIDIELAQTDGREYILKNQLTDIDDDFIFIDTPPSLGLLTINALSCSQYVLIPLQCEFYALEGLAHLLNSLQMIKESLNNDLTISGVILTMYDKRNTITHDVEYDVRSHLDDLVYDTVIPRNVKLPEAPSYGKPAIIYDSKCSGSVAYINLAKEFLKRHKILDI